MMGKQILGAVPVERKVMLFAALEVAGHPQLEGHTVEQAFRSGAWRVLAIDTTPPADRNPDLAALPPYAPEGARRRCRRPPAWSGTCTPGTSCAPRTAW